MSYNDDYDRWENNNNNNYDDRDDYYDDDYDRWVDEISDQRALDAIADYYDDQYFNR